MKSARFVMLALLVLLIAKPALQAQDSVRLPEKAAFHLYLLVGQSNMAGRGKVTAKDLVTNPRVLTLSKDNHWKFAADPIHFDKSVAGVGLGRTFGIVIAEATPGVTVGLIPCAVGGSPISTWQPGGYHEQTRSHPYDAALQRARLATNVGTLKGILWHQGESDCKEDLSPVYEQKLHQLIGRFRKELSRPRVPFIVGQMGQFRERPWNAAKQEVDLAHQSLPTKVPNTAFVNSDGLGHLGDEVHFNTAAYHELGRRYAKAFLKLSDAEEY